MSIPARKSALGIAISLIVFGLGLPVAFWLLAVAIDQALGLTPLLPRSLSLILAATAALIGVFWVSWSYSYLVFVGKGLPLEAFGRALHPTRILVTTGPYAYVRNPMVIGMFFILLGAAFLRGTLSGFVVIPVLMALVALYLAEFEEKALVRRFGADYEEYRDNVPLLIPRVSPYTHTSAGLQA